MTWERISTILGVLAFVVAGAFYAKGVEEDVRSNQQVIQQVQQTQQAIVDWMDKELQAKRAAEERERYRRELCAQGKLQHEECR